MVQQPLGSITIEALVALPDSIRREAR